MLDYKEFRSSIKSGDQLFFTGSGNGGLINKAIFLIIQFMTRSRFGHVGIAYVTGDRVFVVEAVTPRVQLIPLSMKGDFVHIDMSGVFQRFSLLDEQKLLDTIGHRYGTINAVRSAFLKPSTTDSLFCSQMSIDFIKDTRGKDYGEDGYTPGDLFATLLNNNFHSTAVKNGETNLTDLLSSVVVPEEENTDDTQTDK